MIPFDCLFFVIRRAGSGSLSHRIVEARLIYFCVSSTKYNDRKQYVSQEGLGLARLTYHTTSFSCKLKALNENTNLNS